VPDIEQAMGLLTPGKMKSTPFSRGAKYDGTAAGSDTPGPVADTGLAIARIAATAQSHDVFISRSPALDSVILLPSIFR
jgi:streptogramin lyase